VSLASCLYVGTVVHRRLRPRPHRLAYRLFWLYLDLDEIDALARPPLLGIDRAGLVSFHHEDHGPRDGSRLLPWVRGRLAAAGLDLAAPAVRLLCMPRVLGYVFNPISVYYCFEVGRLAAVICEVKNTFGEQTSYVLPVAAGPERRVARAHCAKAMYVSPFITMDAFYDFRLTVPGPTLAVVIRESEGGEPTLVASQTARRVPLTAGTLAGAALTNLLMTFKVTTAIHLQALRLWRKGVPYVPRPSATGRAAAPAAGAPR
jgi:hypothetical protein